MFGNAAAADAPIAASKNKYAAAHASKFRLIGITPTRARSIAAISLFTLIWNVGLRAGFAGRFS